MKIQNDADGNPVMKRVTEYGVAEVAGSHLLVAIRYLQDDSDTVIQLSLTPLQALDFGVRLIDHGRALM